MSTTGSMAAGSLREGEAGPRPAIGDAA